MLSKLAMWKKLAFERDILPCLNPWAAWIKRPLGVLSLTGVAALICGISVSPNGLLVGGVIGTVLAMAFVWPWISLRCLKCRLSFAQSRCREGELAEICLVVTNRSPLPCWGITLEGPCDARHGLWRSIAWAVVPGWTTRQFRWQRAPLLRGHYPQGPVSICSAFPFGLWKAKQRIDVSNDLTVWPRSVPVRRPEFPGSCVALRGGTSDLCAGQQGDPIGVRWYREGDAPKMIHWPLSARLDRLVVSEKESIASGTLLIGVDLDQAVHQGDGADATHEVVIRYVASLCREAVLAHASLVLVADTRQQISVPGSSAGLRQALDWLAKLDVTDEFPPMRSRESCGQWSRPHLVTSPHRDLHALPPCRLHIARSCGPPTFPQSTGRALSSVPRPERAEEMAE